jgi:hypothetical protein
MINFQCLLCYFSKDDTIYFNHQWYVISDNFSFIRHYKYTKEVDRKEAKRTGTFPKLTDAKKTYKIPEFKKVVMATYGFGTLKLTKFIFEINGKTYDFKKYMKDGKDPDKLAKKLAKHLATRYINDSNYRKYVDERLEELEKYDYAGRKKIDAKSINDWNIIKYLSTGMYGATYIVSKNGTKEYVMKTFHTKKGSRSPKAVEKECKITTLAGEIGVGPKVIECSSKEPQYIVMEKLDGPSVQQKYGTLSRLRDV